jgi:type I restriction enzyme S subunit
LCEPVYLSACINSTEGRRQLFRFRKTTSGLNTISLTNVRNTNILLPPIDVQRQFVAFVRRLEAHLAKLNTIHDGSEDLFNALVQCAFKGEL